MAAELKANQNPEIRLAHSGGIIVTLYPTYRALMSPVGALVQMFDPLQVKDLRQIMYGCYAADMTQLQIRAMRILDISNEEFNRLHQYMYADSWLFANIIKAIRTLK